MAVLAENACTHQLLLHHDSIAALLQTVHATCQARTSTLSQTLDAPRSNSMNLNFEPALVTPAPKLRAANSARVAVSEGANTDSMTVSSIVTVETVDSFPDSTTQSCEDTPQEGDESRSSAHSNAEDADTEGCNSCSTTGGSSSGDVSESAAAEDGLHSVIVGGGRAEGSGGGAADASASTVDSSGRTAGSSGDHSTASAASSYDPEQVSNIVSAQSHSVAISGTAHASSGESRADTFSSASLCSEENGSKDGGNSDSNPAGSGAAEHSMHSVHSRASSSHSSGLNASSSTRISSFGVGVGNSIAPASSIHSRLLQAARAAASTEAKQSSSEAQEHEMAGEILVLMLVLETLHVMWRLVYATASHMLGVKLSHQLDV